MFSSKMLKYAAIAVSALIIFVIIGKKAGWFGGIKPIVVSTEKSTKKNHLRSNNCKWENST
jgi:hypothetical protein